MFMIAFQTEAALTAVAGDELAAVAKLINSQKTVVVTVRTAAHGRIVVQFQNLVHGEHGSRAGLVSTFSGDQSRAESPHDTGDVRAYRMAAGDSLKGTENCVIIKCAALHNDLAAQLFRIGQLDDLKDRVLDDRIGKTGGDIADTGAFLLRLFYFGVHENRTPGAKVNRRFGKESHFGKIFHGIIQRLGKCLDEGTTAGGACLI